MALSKLALVAMAVPLLAAVTFQAEIAEWRQKREAGLRRDGGWLTSGALLVVEEARAAAFKAPEGFEELERRAYDDTEFVILRAE